MGRTKWIDVCKGIAIISVVIGHVGTSYHNSNLLLDSFIINFGIELTYSFHMAVFFVISGYLSSKSDKYDKKDVLRKRLISYGIPYLVFSVLAWGLKIVAGGVVNDAVSLKDILGIPLFPLNSLWFIYALLIASISHLLLSKVPKRNRIESYKYIVALFVLKIAATYISQNTIVIESGWNECIIFSFAKYFFWYEFGAYYFELSHNWILQHIKGKKAVLIIAIAVYCGIEIVMTIIQFNNVFIETLISCIGVFIVCQVSVQLSKVNFLSYIGKKSFPIYLLHPYIISIVRIILGKLGIPLLYGIVPICLGTVVGTAIPILIYHFASYFKVLDFWFYPSRYLSK